MFSFEQTIKKMKITVEVNGNPVEIELTKEQVAKVKNQKITDRIKNFSDVLQAVSTERAEKWAQACTYLDQQGIANEKIKLIAEVLNEGWEAEPFNTSQYKYYPWFEVENGAFVYIDSDVWCGGTFVGSRLCYKNSELAEYVGKTFIDIYTKLLS